jgi:MFS family permease
MHSRFRQLPGAVLALGVVSFLTDLSSEMIYPLLPLFLSTVLSAGALSLGVIEGVAESTAAVVKVLSGRWTDRAGRRKPFLLAGYSVSGLVRPLIGLASAWPVVLVLRFADRVGKGVRSSPRDALIADVTPEHLRGSAYGLHRAMDHAGAVAGPLVAAGLLALGLPLRTVFLLAIVPSVLVVAVILAAVKEPAATPPRPRSQASAAGGAAAPLGPEVRRLLLALGLFTLGNSTDAFLLLRLSEAGLAPGSVALVWAAHGVVKMVSTAWGGRLSDAWPRQKLIAAGWFFYAGIYLAFAMLSSLPALVAVFLAYGIYFGLTEPAEKALVSQLVPAGRRGIAFGFYHGTMGLAALPASLLFGAIWSWHCAAAAFSCGAALAAAAALLLLAPLRGSQPSVPGAPGA